MKVNITNVHIDVVKIANEKLTSFLNYTPMGNFEITWIHMSVLNHTLIDSAYQDHMFFFYYL